MAVIVGGFMLTNYRISDIHKRMDDLRADMNNRMDRIQSEIATLTDRIDRYILPPTKQRG